MVVVVVHGKRSIVVGRADGQVARSRSLCDRRLVVDDVDNETTVIKGDTILQQILDHFMRDGLFAQVLKNELHGRVVGKAAILLVEAEEGGMQMDGERGRLAAELAQDVLGAPDMRFGYPFDQSVAGTVGLVVGACVETGGHARPWAAHWSMPSFRGRRCRHGECW